MRRLLRRTRTTPRKDSPNDPTVQEIPKADTGILRQLQTIPDSKLFNPPTTSCCLVFCWSFLFISVFVFFLFWQVLTFAGLRVLCFLSVGVGLWASNFCTPFLVVEWISLLRVVLSTLLFPFGKGSLPVRAEET